MIRIVATGVGVIASPGAGRETFHAGLRAGGRGPVAVADGLAFRAAEFDPKTYIAAAALRRLDRSGILAICAAKMAIADAKLDIPLHRIAIVVGAGACGIETTTAFHRRLIETAGTDPNPMAFPNTVPNAPAGQVAIATGITGYNTTLVQAGACGEEALALAADLLAQGRADAVIAGGVDELAPMLQYTLGRLGGLSGTGCRPLDTSADGTILAEDAGFVVLERAEDATRRGARPLAVLLGIGRASTPTRPLMNGGAEGAISAFRSAIADASLFPADIRWVNSGANGNADSRFTRAILDVCPAAAISSIGGACGESLAIGGVRSVSSVLACGVGEMFGSPWVKTPSAAIDVAREPRPLQGPLLQHGAGTGGVDIALVWGAGQQA